MPTPKRPSDEALETAILWLKGNAGSGDEGPNCWAVADWLEAIQFEDMLRREARAAGIPVARLRKKLAEKAKA